MGKEAGQIIFRAEVDDTGAITGLKRFKKNVEQAGASSKGLFGDISRLGKSALSLTKAFVGFGAGTAGLMALARSAPAVADEMAKIEIESIKLSHSLGQALEPIFQSIANEVLPNLNQFLKDNEESFRKTANAVAYLITKLSELALFEVPKPEGVDIPTATKDGGTTKGGNAADFAESEYIMETASQWWQGGNALDKINAAMYFVLNSPQFALDAFEVLTGIDMKWIDQISPVRE